MRRRFLMLVSSLACAPALLLPAAARAQPVPSELPWTRLAPADLDRYEATVGGVRVNNLALGPLADAEAAGPATVQEFTLTAANRGAEWQRVIVEIVGVREDGRPTFTAGADLDVEPRRNETAREQFFAAEEEMKATAAYWLRVLVLPRD
ncbi:hypothetical protein [Caldovatus aquaticus]|uniref:Uncharacterized protein n=1 Tax=Caldovatus aquaticus TaxID=2865671 RepID=A0ABS7F2N1_9PROT|nr:hypothetical protein [Caldovatus aquaticus]MBW8269257.1 hypothetical protein [Caldovatus aquaticus]